MEPNWPIRLMFPSLVRPLRGRPAARWRQRGCALLLLVAASSAFGQTFLTAPTNPLVAVPQSEGEQIERLLRAGQREAALARVDVLVTKEPRNAQARFLRGVILGDLGRATDAIPVFETLTIEYPELPEPFNNLAVLLASQGKLEQARALLQHAISMQPDYTTAYENLGDLDIALATDAYRRAAGLDPASAGLRSKLALARDTGAKLRASR